MSPSKVVLVVEDEPALVDVYRRALENRGYQVLAAVSGVEAIQAVEEHGGPLDLLISDIVLPGMGGRELVWRIRERYPDVPVILASGYADAGGALQMMEGPEPVFVPKPLDLELLLDTVRGMIGEG